MSLFTSKPKPKTLVGNVSVEPRWRKILKQFDSTEFHDLSTGKTYFRSQFIPLYNDVMQTQVDYFGIHSSKEVDKVTGEVIYTEQIYTKFLRLPDDGTACSLMQDKRNIEDN